jgi:hypothetical protein
MALIPNVRFLTQFTQQLKVRIQFHSVTPGERINDGVVKRKKGKIPQGSSSDYN